MTDQGLSASPASAFDLAETLDDSGRPGRMDRVQFGLMARQIAEGAAITLRNAGGELVCVAGLWPEADHAEAWLATGPAFRRELLGALRWLGRALDAIVADAGVAEVRAYALQRQGVAGQRLGARLGFGVHGAEETSLGRVLILTRKFGDRP